MNVYPSPHQTREGNEMIVVVVVVAVGFMHSSVRIDCSLLAFIIQIV